MKQLGYRIHPQLKGPGSWRALSEKGEERVSTLKCASQKVKENPPPTPTPPRSIHQEKIHTAGAQGQHPDDSLMTEASGATGKSHLRPERPVCATQCPGRLVYQLLRLEYLVLQATFGLKNAL